MPLLWPVPVSLCLASFFMLPPFVHRLCLLDVPLLRLMLYRFEPWYLVMNSLLGVSSGVTAFPNPYHRVFTGLIWVTCTPLVFADAIALSPYLIFASQVIIMGGGMDGWICKGDCAIRAARMNICFPHQVKCACRFSRFGKRSEGTTGARKLIGPCRPPGALNRPPIQSTVVPDLNGLVVTVLVLCAFMRFNNWLLHVTVLQRCAVHALRHLD
jgi:hypothetical protein